jgi:hypothetical protein
LEHNKVRAIVGDSRKVAGLLYCWWNVWKELNKRIFDAMQNSELHVACAAKDDIGPVCLGFQPSFQVVEVKSPNKQAAS